jgi:hypothetical protein
MVRPSEHKKIMRDREKAEVEKQEAREAAAQLAAGKKAAPPKKPAKGEVVEEEIVIDESEDANVELIEVIEEPEHSSEGAAK